MKTKRFLSAILVIVLSLCQAQEKKNISLPEQVQEKKIVSFSEINSLVRGKTLSLVSILEDGNLVLLTNPNKADKLRLYWFNIHTQQSESADLPVSQLEYFAITPDGKEAVFYVNDGGEFWHIEFSSQKVTQWNVRKKGKEGFGLYGGERGRLNYVGNTLYGWGYWYDKDLQFLADYIVKLNPTAADEGTLQKVVGYDNLTKIAKQNFSRTQYLGDMHVGGPYLVFAAMEKKKSGVLLSYHMKTGKEAVIEEFQLLLGSALSTNGRYLAYITKAGTKPGPGTLYFYDFVKQKKQEVLSDMLIRPIFNAKGDKVVIGNLSFDPAAKKAYQNFIVIDIAKNFAVRQVRVSQKQIFIDWKLVQNDKYLIFFDKDGIYRVDL